MSTEKQSLWPFEIKDLRDIGECLDAALRAGGPSSMLYLYGGQLEVRCDHQRVGYFRIDDDSWVFDLDRAENPDEE